MNRRLGFLAAIVIAFVMAATSQVTADVGVTDSARLSALVSQASEPGTPSPARQQDCYGQTEVGFDFMGSTLWSGVRRMIQAGNYVYCATAMGLMVYDLNDLSALNPVNKLEFNQRGPYWIEKNGDVAYVACHDGFEIYDISNPPQMLFVGFYRANLIVQKIQINGNRAYLCGFPGEMEICDITNPQIPTHLGRYSVLCSANSPQDMAVAGTRAYVLDANYGLYIHDIANPASPTLLGHLEEAGDRPYQSLAVTGNLAILGFNAKIVFYDVSDPSAPVQVGELETTDAAMSITVTGQHALVSTFNSGLWVIDIANPQSPEIIASRYPEQRPGGVNIFGNLALIPEGHGGAHALDIENIADPIPLADFAYQSALDVGSLGDYALVAAGLDGLYLVNLAAAGGPTIVDHLEVPGYAMDVQVRGNYGYVAAREGGLLTVDLSTAPNLTLAGQLVTAYKPVSVTLDGDYAYLCCISGGGVLVCDIADPAAPALLGRCYLAADCRSIAPFGNYAYVSCGSGLVLIDISDKANPQGIIVADLHYKNSAAMSVIDGYLVGCVDDGIRVYDITNPLIPSVVSDCSPVNSMEVNSLAFYGNYAFLAASASWGIYAVNVSSPPQSYGCGMHGTYGDGLGIGVSDRFTCVAAGGTLLAFRSSQFACGDADGSGAVDISDAVKLISYIFSGGAAPAPLQAGDADCSGSVDISDVVYLIAYIFTGGPAPCAGC